MIYFDCVKGPKWYSVEVSFKDGTVWSLSFTEFLESCFEQRFPEDVETLIIYDDYDLVARWIFQIIE